MLEVVHPINKSHANRWGLFFLSAMLWDDWDSANMDFILSFYIVSPDSPIVLFLAPPRRGYWCDEDNDLIRISSFYYRKFKFGYVLLNFFRVYSSSLISQSIETHWRWLPSLVHLNHYFTKTVRGYWIVNCPSHCWACYWLLKELAVVILLWSLCSPNSTLCNRRVQIWCTCHYHANSLSRFIRLVWSIKRVKISYYV